MRVIQNSLLLAGAAALGLSILALPATAKDPTVHTMTVQLPGGGSETIQYTGEVAPKVRFDQPSLLGWSAPIAFGVEPSLEAFDSIIADMGRQMDAFWRQADTMARWPQSQGLNRIELQNLGPGASAYSVVSESFGDNFCSKVTEITTSNGGKPKVVSRTTGNCDASPAGSLTNTSVSPSGAKPTPVGSTVPASDAPWMIL